MQNAVVATEDQRFWSHGGVDVRGIMRAASENIQGNMQGGSTLTQQYVKNVLIHKASKEGDILAVEEARESTLERKLREAKLAINLEKSMPKKSSRTTSTLLSLVPRFTVSKLPRTTTSTRAQKTSTLLSLQQSRASPNARPPGTRQ